MADRILADGSFVASPSLLEQAKRSDPGRKSVSTVPESSSTLAAAAAEGLPAFVPHAPPIPSRDLDALESFLAAHPQCLVITGAGVSTESRIPDYRSPGGAYSTGFKPMTHQEFLRSERSRSRYWARSFAGWYRYGAVRPNPAHAALAALQAGRWVGPIVTQNVDGLHQKGGAADVLELHGATRRVRCLDCGTARDREEVQRELAALNPEADRVARAAAAGEDRRDGGGVVGPGKGREGDAFRVPVRRPDGDVELQDACEGFRVPPCYVCGGPLKPDVVFFGDSVPPAVWSAFRLVRAAKARGAPLAILSIGPTRADDLADLKIEARAGDVLPKLAHRFRKRRAA
ncbi:hypothetical protein QBZ16_001889 [Prototheca wickerhamii]|uniref:Deacetylase sirtuin-type domain-containing protein n=1 Tax=Prototheca wickerhamii TaxID=3111 RepID=A0AAD9ILN1_PROWI|nr:hypothetical protein QBZ16_001889 [Prototheca wickerhamii]